ncbi:hypothetical protein PtA15_5A426 [Puccinia triticina]|uniref:F-box domain-containing protein n=1 Tax=Puccinia triticina TaxID=208348 RepID=A0ABY7CKH1_9BASI|nr:uncharacterized protein PtA15_5A426 [Puccinia triticina]WAQ84853.1 hypothetical protein PtA15_5A426 [Puccinia triticina]
MVATRDPKLLVTRVFQRGITAFKAEDYQRAIQCFDQAFEASSNESVALKINILDSRAASKEKLNDIKSSLSDAKQVIDLAPESPKGYIRAARLFNQIDRFPASVKMFELAITKLKSNPKRNTLLIETLQAELQQVRLREKTHVGTPQIRRATSSSASSKPKSNFVGKMPFEIFIDIVSSLDIPTRFRCMAVCSSWRQTILNTPNLWNTLCLNSHNYQKLLTKAKYWLNRLGPDQQLHTLNISVSPIWPPSTTHSLLTFLAERLSTKTSPNACLRSFSFHHAGASYGIAEIQKTFSVVIAFAYSNRANLFNLELKVPAFITCPLTLPALLADFPCLKGLKLQGERGQSLLFIKSESFYQNYVPSTTPTPSGLVSPDNNDSSASCHAQLLPLNTSQRTENVLDQQLEALFAQCVSFVPSEEGPIKLSSLRSVSLISTAINAISPDSAQINTVNQYVPGIDFTRLPKLENLDLCRVAVGQEQWEPVWRSFERLPTLRRLRLDGLPHFIPHFLELANVPLHWSPQDHVDQPFRVEMETIVPELEFISLSSLDSSMSYKFLAVFGYQFAKLDSLSVAGLLLDSDTESLLIGALRHLPPLVNLNLSNTHARPEVIDAIKPDRLQHLQLGNCTRVTFRSVARLATPNNLQFLDITGCHLISTREMIEWLARRVKVLIWREGQDLPRRSARRLFLD